MIPQLTPEQSAALLGHGEKPMPVVDPATNHLYVLVDQATHEQAMTALRERDDDISIQRGIQDMQSGRYAPADEAFARINAEFEAKYGK